MSSILLVEDDVDTSEAVARYLGRSGHAVKTASSGRAALGALLASTPDAVLLDVRLPEMDGVMLLKIVRSYLRWRDLPVFVLTAYPAGPHIERLQQLGVRRIFNKADYHLEELLVAIEPSTDAPPA